jgi:hypothetical protein
MIDSQLLVAAYHRSTGLGKAAGPFPADYHQIISG